MASWLCVTTENNWKVIRDRKVWGVPGKNIQQIQNAKVNDFLVFYVKQRRENDTTVGPQVKGISRVVSEPFRSDESIFADRSPGEEYAWRVKIEHLAISKEPLHFKTLVPNLKFVKNKKKWFLSVFGKAMRAIPEEDFELIRSAIESRR